MEHYIYTNEDREQWAEAKAFWQRMREYFNTCSDTGKVVIDATKRFPIKLNKAGRRYKPRTKKAA